jgi:hypothetical protein
MPEHEVPETVHEAPETRAALLFRCAELQTQLAESKKRLNLAAMQLMNMAAQAVVTDPTDSQGVLSRSIKELGIARIISDVKTTRRELLSAQMDADRLNET